MVRKLPHGVRKPEIPCPGNAGLLRAPFAARSSPFLVHRTRHRGCVIALPSPARYTTVPNTADPQPAAVP